jgi:hypothetical protein
MGVVGEQAVKLLPMGLHSLDELDRIGADWRLALDDPGLEHAQRRLAPHISFKQDVERSLACLTARRH